MTAGAYRILVADDDSRSRESLVALLSFDGFHALPLEGGQAALRWLRRWSEANEIWERSARATVPVDPVHLLVLDYNMPDLNGLEVLRRVRIELQISLPTIVVSGECSQDLERSVFEEGGYALVPKPIEPSGFRTLVWSLVEGES
ncbi:MAG: response regulator [Planctomycetota bacterium]